MKTRTHGTMRRSRLSMLAIALIVVVTAGSASAQWQVTDQTAQQYLEQIRDRVGEGDVNDRLKQINEQHYIGKHKVSGEPVAEPEQKIDKKDITLDKNIERCAASAQEQKAICEEVVRTENSQYLYMVKMYEITEKRKERLKEIEDERNGLNEKDYGKLQDNTNKLIALHTRMTLDRAQMESAMHAYDARLRYLRQYQVQQTNDALRGKKTDGGDQIFGIGLGDIGSMLTAGIILKGALESQKSERPAGFKDVSWD